MTAHPHAELIKRFAEDAQVSDTPWEFWYFKNRFGVWENLDSPPEWRVDTEYRRQLLANLDVDALSNFIRSIDGNNTMGVGELAERIVAWVQE